VESGPPNRRQHGQETTRRSIPGRKVADRAGRYQERERLGDVSASRDRSESVLSMEGRSGAGSEGSAWGEKRCRGRNREGPSHPAVRTNAGTEGAGDRNPKKRRGGVSCGDVHSQAREMVTEGYTATLVAATLAIS